MEQAVDTGFIRRAVEQADLNAVKLALYQITGDKAYAALPVPARMEAGDKAWLIDRAVAWLEQHAGSAELPEPPEPALRRMMGMVSGSDIGDLEFEARRDLTGFKPFPYMADWTGERPDIPEDFSVAIIGSGFAGIGVAVQFERLGIPNIVYERRAEPGGTWSINRYPDVRVDTISITYEFLFERGHLWSEYFGRGPEVREYLKRVSEKYGVRERTCFEHDLTRASFDEARDKWTLEFDTPDGPKTVEASVIISASGLFAKPKIAQFAGQETFGGEIVHTALWRDDVDLAGKRVATIGNGSTGVQMLGAIAREAAQVSVFQRTPQWISPRDRYGQPIEPEVAWLVRNLPGYWNWWRYSATSGLFDTHALMLSDADWRAKGGKVNPQNDAMREFLTKYIETETGGRRDLIEKLMPDYAPFSRRPIVDNGWYRALTRDNVELVTEGIDRFTPTGILTVDGKHREIDVVVTATGFEVVQYLWPARYVGRGGVDLHEAWSAKDGPRAYLGMMVPDFPNLFMIYGPNSQPLSGGPATPVWFATWAAFAAKCVIRMLETRQSRVEVRQEAYQRYNDALDEEARKLIQMSAEGEIEKNYYVDAGHNRLLVSAPWYSPYFHRLCSKVEWDDLEMSGATNAVGAARERVS